MRRRRRDDDERLLERLRFDGQQRRQLRAIAAQLGRGQWAAWFTIAGVFAGVALFGYLKERAERSARNMTTMPTTGPGL